MIKLTARGISAYIRIHSRVMINDRLLRSPSAVTDPSADMVKNCLVSPDNISDNVAGLGAAKTASANALSAKNTDTYSSRYITPFDGRDDLLLLSSILHCTRYIQLMNFL